MLSKDLNKIVTFYSNNEILTVRKNIYYFFNKKAVRFLFSYVPVLLIYFLSFPLLLTRIKKINYFFVNEDLYIYTTKNQLNSFSRLLSLYKTNSCTQSFNLKYSDVSFARYLKNYFDPSFNNIIQEIRSEPFIAYKIFEFMIALSVNQSFLTYKCLVVSSDHSPLVLGISNLFQSKGKVVCYTQHADITNIFPVNDFDISFLYNQLTFDIYKDIGSNMKKIMYVNKHSDPPSKNIKTNPVKRILICLGLDLKENAIIQLINNHIDYEFVIRPHPASKIDLTRIQNIQGVVIESKTKIVDLVDAFQFAVVGNSAVIYDLIYFGLPVCFYDELDFIEYDYYKYLANGLVLNYSEGIEYMDILGFYSSSTWSSIYSLYYNYFLDSFPLVTSLSDYVNEQKISN